MRISHKHRFVFFALPKAGSSSVRQLLEPWADLHAPKNFFHRSEENPFYPHITPKEAKPLFLARGWDFDAYRKFALTRNPWDRAVSLYRHVKQADPTTPEFKQWLRTTEARGRGGGGGPWERWRQYGAWSATYFLSDRNDECLVDHTIRLEDIESELLPYLRSLGISVAEDCSVPHANTRGHGEDYRPWYDQESAGWISRRYRDDIERWHYVFDTVSI
ncbi:MAG: sulfotransferase family 2 domain-containing protein [Pseudomonadota bacterium]